MAAELKKQIIAMGGGGFSMEPDNLLLDRYVLKQTGKAKPKVCFVPTASGDSQGYIERFYKAFATLECEPSHLSVFKLPTSDLESFVLEKDLIYVGGGNTRNLLLLWKAWGLDVLFRKAWENGTVLAGLSAGAICWFEQGSTDSWPGELRALDGLGFLPGSCVPHYDGEADRRPTTERMMVSGELMAGLAADDGAGLHFVGTDLKRVVTSRPNAKAYALRSEEGKFVETVLETVYLGEHPELV
jgi:dipeptidase E